MRILSRIKSFVTHLISLWVLTPEDRIMRFQSRGSRWQTQNHNHVWGWSQSTALSQRRSQRSHQLPARGGSRSPTEHRNHDDRREMWKKGCGDRSGDGSVLSATRTLLCVTTVLLAGHVKASSPLGGWNSSAERDPQMYRDRDSARVSRRVSAKAAPALGLSHCLGGEV